MHDRFPRPIVAWWSPPRNGPQNSNLQSIIPCTLRFAYSYPPKTNVYYVLNTFSVASARLRHSEAPLRCQCAPMVCLLYTSDAADEEDSVDLGGRRIIKKK